MQPLVSPKSRLVAVVLAVLLGVFGIHRFYVGKVTTAVVQLVLTITVVLSWVTAIWVIVDIIMILLGTFTDKEGRVLTDWNAPVMVVPSSSAPAAPASAPSAETSAPTPESETTA